MKDCYFKRQLKSSNVCAGLYSARISDFVFRRCQFPNSLVWGQYGGKRLPFLQELYFKTRVLLT